VKPRTLVFRLLFVVPMIVTACGGGDSAPGGDAGAVAGASRDGSLIITRADGLYEFTIASGDIRPLVQPDEPNAFVLDPALSPSARHMAYVVQPPPKVVDGIYDAGSDIWIADRDGSNARRLFEHEQANQLVRYPRWLDDQTIYAIIQVIESTDGVTQATYTLQRIDVTTGERRAVLEDVVAFDVSPDGSRIAYARLEATSGETLQAVDIDGEGNRVELVPLTEDLAPFNSPHFSPDGERIAFAAADQNMPLPTGQRLISSNPVSATLDGLPQDIWLVDAEGSAPQLAAELKEDIPALTWGGDGEYIYVLGANALYEINLGNGAVAQIGEGVFHGQLTWAPGA